LLRLSLRVLWLLRAARQRLLGLVGRGTSMRLVRHPYRPDHPPIIHVPPQKVRHEFTGHVWRASFAKGYVFDGTWDRMTVRRPPLTASDDAGGAKARAFVRDVFLHQRSYRDTDEYRSKARIIERGGTAWGCTTIEGLDQRYEALLQVERSIREHGYRSQRELGRSDEDEVTVFVDRDGELIHQGHGRHRLWLAELHQVPTIPVRVLGLHAAWVSCWVHRQGGDPAAAVHAGLASLEAPER
jgi:hypothetical protein